MNITHRIQLPSLMKSLGLPMVASEAGVAEGNFSRDLITEGIEKLYSVDNWGTIEGQSGDAASSNDWHLSNYNNAIKLLKPFGEKSIILKGLSSEMAKHIPDNTLGLVYVDCCHEYLCVKSDIESYYPKLVNGGIMAFHDYLTYDGVSMAVNEFARVNNLELHLLPENAVKDAGCFFLKK